MTGTELRQIYLSAHEGVEGWWISLRVSVHDEEGSVESRWSSAEVVKTLQFDDWPHQLLAVLDVAAAMVRADLQLPRPL